MRIRSLAILASLFIAGVAVADQTVVATRKPVAKATVTVSQLKTLAALYPAPKGVRERKHEEVEEGLDPQPNPNALPGNQWPPAGFQSVNPLKKVIGGRTDGGDVTIPGPLFSLSSHWGGPILNESGYIPPDSTGDVGFSSVIIAANGRIKSYNRTGGAGSLNLTPDAFFSPIAANMGVSDPRVVFDRLTGRWFIAGIATDANVGNRILLAWSNVENINGAGVTWTMIGFVPDAATFADYETLGVDDSGVYLGTNKFSSAGGFVTSNLYGLPKATLLAGSPTWADLGTTGASGSRLYTPQPCTNDVAGSNVMLFIGADTAFYSQLKYKRVTFTAPSSFSVGAVGTLATNPTHVGNATVRFPSASSALQAGSAVDHRLFQARICTDSAGNQSVWTAQNINVDATGAAVATGTTTTSENRFAARWYQLGNPFSGTLSITQSGTLFDSTAGSTNVNHWMPSIAMNRQGHAFMGMSRAGANLAPGLGGAQRLATDTLGTMTNLGTLVAGANYYNVQGTGGAQRWGDYSLTTIDPRDGMSIWSFQEICNANNSWQVHVVKMLSAAPTASMTAAGITQGATTNVTINGTGFFDPDASYPDHLSINCGAGITVNSFTWTPTQIVANVTVAETAAVGTRNVTVTNPDGQSVTVTNGLTVNQLVKNVSGSLTLSNFVGSSANLPFTLELRDATSNAVLQTVNLTGLGAGNTFAFTTTQLSGSYKLRVKAGKRFLGIVNNVTLSLSGASGLSYTLTNGDVDGNNTVNNTDYTIMRAAWGANSSSSNWNDGADLNGDGTVGNLDFAILRANLGLSGL